MGKNVVIQVYVMFLRMRESEKEIERGVVPKGR